MINVAVIGAGGAGRQHARELSKQEGIKLVSVVDLDADLAKQRAEEFGAESWGTDYTSVLKNDDIQAVTIATPPHTRKEILMGAMESKKDILCEKPIALDLGDAEEIIQKHKESGVKLMFDFGPRNLPIFAKVKELVSSEDHGKPIWVWCRYLLVASPKSFMPPAWFWRKETGGGHLIENGCHVIDFIRWIMGEVKSVTAVVDTLKFKESFPPYFENPNIEDIGNIILEHENGGISVVANGCIAPGGWGISMEIATEKSFISLFRNKGLTIEQDGKQCWEETYKEGWNPITFGIRKFVQYLKDGSTPVASSRDAKAVLEITLAAYKSSKEGRKIDLPLLTP